MLKLLRIVLLCVIVLLLVEVVVGVASDSTGSIEKAALVGGGLLLAWAGSRVRRLGAARPNL